VLGSELAGGEDGDDWDRRSGAIVGRLLVLDLSCVDRVYGNLYIPSLQVGGQVVTLLTAHLGDHAAVMANLLIDPLQSV